MKLVEGFGGVKMDVTSYLPPLVEMLKRRYICGEINIDAFEALVGHAIAQEEEALTASVPSDTNTVVNPRE